MVKECKTVHTNEQNESVTEYHGDQKRTTKSGRHCRNWKEVEYIQDDLTDIDESDMQNFCRFDFIHLPLISFVETQN